MQKEVRQWSDRKKEIETPLFPNYVFVKTSSQERFNLMKVRGLVNFISFGGSPVSIPEEEIESMAKDLGVKPSEVREMEKRLGGTDMSFDPLADSDDEEASFAPSQYLEDHDADPADIFEKENLDEINTSQLYEAINSLDDRSRDIIQDRWLADEKLTLHELADKYDISAERVRQIEKNAMKKVKQAFSSGE